MLSRKKELLEYVDFYKKDIPQNKRLKNKLIKGLTVFVGVQMVFASFNMFRMNNYMDEQKQLRKVAYSNYQEVKEAIKSGDQYKIIDTYSKLKSRDSITSDILSATTIMISRHNLEENDSEYKIAPETLKTMEYIYQNRWNSGFMAKQKERDSISCFIGDFTCYIGRPIIQSRLQQFSDHLYKFAASDNYNINHWEQYNTWIKAHSKVLEQTGKEYLNDSPGDVYVKSQGNLSEVNKYNIKVENILNKMPDTINQK